MRWTDLAPSGADVEDPLLPVSIKVGFFKIIRSYFAEQMYTTIHRHGRNINVM
jgi:hypothetical protein